LKFKDVLLRKLGQTNMVIQTINIDAKPIQMQLHQIPNAYQKRMEKELEEMKENGIIQTSMSK